MTTEPATDTPAREIAAHMVARDMARLAPTRCTKSPARRATTPEIANSVADARPISAGPTFRSLLTCTARAPRRKTSNTPTVVTETACSTAVATDIGDFRTLIKHHVATFGDCSPLSYLKLSRHLFLRHLDNIV